MPFRFSLFGKKYSKNGGISRPSDWAALVAKWAPPQLGWLHQPDIGQFPHILVRIFNTWKWWFPKGISFSRLPFSGSMLNFGRVSPIKNGDFPASHLESALQLSVTPASWMHLQSISSRSIFPGILPANLGELKSWIRRVPQRGWGH